MIGVVNFLKPPGMSSNGAVVFLRGVLGAKTGHAGTLDPGACGVLPICVGKATKISSYLMSGRKEYVAEIAFGKRTDTGDSYGEVIEASEAPLPEAASVKESLQAFLGNTTQRTPMYSAAKHNGRKLYQLARKGIEVEAKMRAIVIHEIEYLRQTRGEAHLIRVVCGKGTYIRTLCEDIGKSLGTAAYMSFLSRTKCAGLRVDDAITADEIKALGENKQNALQPIAPFLSGLPRIDAPAKDRRRLFNGNEVESPAEDIETAAVFVNGELLGIGRAYGGTLKMTTLLVDE